MRKIYLCSGMVILVLNSMTYAANSAKQVETAERQAVVEIIQHNTTESTVKSDRQNAIGGEDSDPKKRKETETSASAVVEHTVAGTALQPVTKEEMTESTTAAIASAPVLFNDTQLVLCVGETATYTISTSESRIRVDFNDGSDPIIVNRNAPIEKIFKKPGNYYVVMTPLNSSGGSIEYLRKAVYTTVYSCYLPVNHNLRNAEY